MPNFRTSGVDWETFRAQETVSEVLSCIVLQLLSYVGLRGCGLMVSTLAFYSNDSSSNMLKVVNSLTDAGAQRHDVKFIGLVINQLC